jgi:2-polyprenyl-6-methoxyphenol hydroxylase-like FAD-dependent oxidoreductase
VYRHAVAVGLMFWLRQRCGIEAVLVERTTELKEIGAGIAIAANPMKVERSSTESSATFYNVG